MAQTLYKVTTESDPLRLRQTAEISDNNIIARIPKGSIVSLNSVLTPVSGWIAVNYGSYSGYASAQYLTLVDSNETTNNTTDNTVVPSDTTTTTTDTNDGSDKTLIIGAIVAVGGVLLKLFL